MLLVLCCALAQRWSVKADLKFEHDARRAAISVERGNLQTDALNRSLTDSLAARSELKNPFQEPPFFEFLGRNWDECPALVQIHNPNPGTLYPSRVNGN